ncbi:hypothetical protein L1N85_14420 [Paenibacillus alkaliterrae]|uniref:hypothetical protein n=1 Tax=Paenibacillus alkaliterrae TaxID=320909 RepID=UPI001F2CF038|nr:hypothetical protein [Paenibacillus alkaliterrae]MCF2939615.1 hypothetical protein [Paenibacillus alkaliterrae]
MEEHVICPWCLTEIVWDEEIGPEKHCPHCDNELSAYRTIELGYDEDEVEADEYERAVQTLKASDAQKAAKQHQGNWLEDEVSEEEDEDDSDHPNHKRWTEQGDGFRSADSSRFAVEEKVQRILDDQDEVPECPSCREYMLEAGTQTVNDQQFEPKFAPSIVGPVLTTPFQLTLYVCPSCFQTSTWLSQKDRDHLLARLAPND